MKFKIGDTTVEFTSDGELISAVPRGAPREILPKYSGWVIKRDQPELFQTLKKAREKYGTQPHS